MADRPNILLVMTDQQPSIHHTYLFPDRMSRLNRSARMSLGMSGKTAKCEEM
jgi:hypothetical protein